MNKKNNSIIVSEWDKKKSLEINACHDPGSLAMPNGDPRDGFFLPTLTLMIYSYIIYAFLIVTTAGNVQTMKLPDARVLQYH